MIAHVIITNWANIPIRQVLAYRTGMNRTLGLHDCVCKCLCIRKGKTQHVKSQALRGLTTDTRKPCKLICQFLQGRREILHIASLEKAAQVQATG
jgi:hypothetical protein